MNFFETFFTVLFALYVYNRSEAIFASMRPVLEFAAYAIGVMLVLSIPLCILWGILYVAFEYSSEWYGKGAIFVGVYLGYIFASLLFSFAHDQLKKLRAYRFIIGLPKDIKDIEKTDTAA